MSILRKALSVLRKPKYLIIIALLIVGGGVVAAKIGGNASELDVITANTGNLEDVVLVNGKVRAAQNVDLSVERSGRVTKVYKQSGDTVAAGDIILTTNADELYASLARARATLEREEVRLEALSTSARPEEVVIAEQNIRSAESELTAANNDLIDTVRDAYNKVDDAIRNKADLYTVGGAYGLSLNFPVSDEELKRLIRGQRPELESQLNALKSKISTLDGSTVKTTVPELRVLLADAQTYLNRFALAINSVIPNSAYPLETLSVWKTNINSARTSVTSALQSVTAAERRVVDATSAVSINKEQLTIKQRGGSETDVRGQRAAVSQARADVSAVEAQIEGTLIRAPFAGKITRVDAEPGKSLEIKDTVVSLISVGALEIEVNVPEVNISKITPGKTARITLDAYGSNSSFEGTVVSVDLSSKEIDGVESYKARIQFKEVDERIKVGMTANVFILADKREGVVIIPRSAITNENGQSYVEKVISSNPRQVTTQKTQVTTGLVGSSGVEIVSGLSAGDQVAVKKN